MLTEYIRAAMEKVTYKILDDGAYFGEVPELPGAWASAVSLEACRKELQEVMEGWILVGLRRGTAIPPLAGPLPRPGAGRSVAEPSRSA
jgi:predicted RNase H-like HicB family nuclease